MDDKLLNIKSKLEQINPGLEIKIYNKENNKYYISIYKDNDNIFNNYKPMNTIRAINFLEKQFKNKKTFSDK